VASVIVSGAIANKHLHGGEAWVRLSWALGFKRLGFQVYFVEQIGRETRVDAPQDWLSEALRLAEKLSL